MSKPKTIPLSPDESADEIAGLPKPLEPDGSVEFDTPIGNPDETVNLGPDAIDVDGVETNVPDDPNPKTDTIYPKSTKQPT